MRARHRPDGRHAAADHHRPGVLPEAVERSVLHHRLGPLVTAVRPRGALVRRRHSAPHLRPTLRLLIELCKIHGPAQRLSIACLTAVDPSRLAALRSAPAACYFASVSKAMSTGGQK